MRRVLEAQRRPSTFLPPENPPSTAPLWEVMEGSAPDTKSQCRRLARHANAGTRQQLQQQQLVHRAAHASALPADGARRLHPHLHHALEAGRPAREHRASPHAHLDAVSGQQRVIDLCEEPRKTSKEYGR